MTSPGSGKSTIGVRVRPNSHDFIRLLQAELATKKATFYVDVKARTGQASNDVRAWARGPLQKIHAAVPVSASFLKANTQLADWRRNAAKKSVTIPIHADTSPAERQILALRAIASQGITVPVRADTKRVQQDVDRAARARAPRSAGGDSGLLKFDPNAAEREAKKFQTTLDKILKDQKLKVDVDTKPAERNFHALLEKFGSELAPKVEVEVELDTSKAEAKELAFRREAQKDIKRELDIQLKEANLKLIEARIKRLGEKAEVNLRVKTTGLERAEKALKGFEKRMGSLSLVRSLDLGPFNLGKPQGFLGTLTTITALAAALPAVVTGVAALSDGLVRMAAAAALVPGAIGGILASLSTFSIATKGVGDALSAMFALWDEGASEQASASRRTIQAQNNLSDAVYDEAKAQRGVAKARREALHDLRDLNNELRGSVLNEAQAILDVQAARDAYAQGAAEGFENDTERLQLQLNIRKAEQGLSETREDAIKTQEKANEAQAQGVEGSDKVQDALHAQTRAIQSAAEAMEALNSSQATGALGKFKDQLAQLSPNAQSFLLALADLKSPLTAFRNELQDTFFEGFADRVGSVFNNLIGVIEPGMQSIAGAMNQTILQVFDTLETPEGKSIIERILGGTAEAQKALTGVIDPLIKGVGTLVAAGAEHLPQVVELFGDLATRFANFIDEADRTGKLDEFLDKGVAALEDMAEIGIQLVGIINKLGTAFGGDILQNINDLVTKFNNWLATAEGQKEINEYIAEAKEMWKEWKPVLEQLPDVFKAVADGARAVLDIVLPILKEFGEFAKDHPALVAGIVGAWLGAKVIIAPLTTIFKALSGIVKVIGKIPGVASLMARIGGGLSTLGVPGVGPRVGPGGAPAGPAGAAAAARVGLGSMALTTLAVPAATTAAMLAVTPDSGDLGVADLSQEDAQKVIDEANSRVPTGLPKSDTQGASDIVNALHSTGGAVGNWLFEAMNATDHGSRAEFAKRYAWFLSQPNAADLMANPTADFSPPIAGSYATGGYTPWGRDSGKLVQLHGKEYVQPADTTAYYGVRAMQAIHQRRVPPALLRSFQGGGLNEEEERQHLRASEPNPAGGGVLSALQTGIGSATNVISNVASQGVSQLQAGVGTGPAPGPAAGTPNGPIIGSVPGLGTPPGPLAPAAPGLAPTPVANTPADDQLSIDLFGIKIPLGGTPAGWPGGQAPVGLGGGPTGPDGKPPMDIRNYGIGPGPPGSTPSDWIKYTAQLGGEFITNLGGTLIKGALGFFGLEGVLDSPYAQAASGLAGHFLGAGSDKSKTQGAGAGETNAQTQALLDAYDSMALNPAYPGVPTLPGGVIDPSTGSALPPGMLAGLQPATANGERQIRAHFPWATNIGGVRPDSKKWHPSGLALDVMVPGGTTRGGRNPEGFAKGQQLYEWLTANQAALGIDYMLWQTDEGGDHYDHVHVNFAASGAPGGAVTSVHAATDAADAAAVDQALKDSGLDPTLGVSDGGPTTQQLRDAGLIPPMPGGPAPKPASPSIPDTIKDIDPKRLMDIFSGRYNGGYIDSFYNGGMVPMASPSDWGGFGQPGPGIGAGLGGYGTVRPGGGPPTGFWSGPERVSPDRMWPGPLPGTNVPGSPGAGIHGRKIWDIAGSGGPRPTKPGWARGGYRNGGYVRSFALGGLNLPPMGLVTPPRPYPPGPQVNKMITPPPKPTTPGPSAAPKPAIPTITPAAPPMAPTPHVGAGAAPGPRVSGQVAVGPRPFSPSENAPGSGSHVHPALKKGIQSAAQVGANLASSAVSGAMGAFGIPGAGAAGQFIGGLVMQGGKIAEDIANVGSSFLVGNITGGTTENPYGVTQRGSIPSGGTRVVDASNNQYGDVYTNNIDEYFARKRREEAVHAQSNLGRWGNA